MDALPFLSQPPPAKRPPVYVLNGDEDFLKRLARETIIASIVGEADPSFAVTMYPGEKLDFSTVRNDLDTLPFLSPARVVIVDQADPFVTAHREALERYLQKPSPIGVLVLDVKTFPETTKLAKALPDAAKIVCKAPANNQLAEWCRTWCQSRHGKTLQRDAAEMLVELVGSSMGLLDQEMGKLAVSVGAKAAINTAAVDALIGRSREANVFHILNAIGEGNATEAMRLLQELFADGEDAFAILGPLTAQLRKLATVNRYVATGHSLGLAMDRAGVAKWPQARQSMEKQLRHLGRRRLDKLTDWLTDIHMGIRGDNPLPPRTQVERLIARLARKNVG
ncbi:MAG: DNA polymerase III subunit delta [Bacteroidales bacterium]|nr:DNA polymerase III subunit delta [Bacteroidales bacterium]